MTTPTPAQLRKYALDHNLTSSMIGALLHVRPRTVRYWMRDDDPRTMPYTAWYTLQAQIQALQTTDNR